MPGGMNPEMIAAMKAAEEMK